MQNQELLLSLEGLVSGVPHPITNLANTAALLWQQLPEINWVGFYLMDKGSLWLGPFAGKPACTSIAPGRGVCGTAFMQNETLVVPDVHAFAGHIACDAASRSEVVVPLHADVRVIGVLDVDSPITDRFSQADKSLLEDVARLLETHCDFAKTGYDLLMPQ